MAAHIELRQMEHQPAWARPHHERIPAPFGGYWQNTISKTTRELAHLNVDHAIIQVIGPRVEIRRDGWLSARSNVDPPVIVSFDSEHGPLSYRADRYDHWQSNVHAIALTLERLRAVDRYGCVSGGEQYKGWAALPATTDSNGDDPIHVLALIVGIDDTAVRRDIPGAVKRARAAVHPDRCDGDRLLYDMADEAARQLGH